VIRIGLLYHAFIFSCLLAGCSNVSDEHNAGDTTTIDATAQLIFQNECAGKMACLTSWNQGEEFASLGIGHFIWYPEGVPQSQKRFHESFPELVSYLVQRGATLPVWLRQARGCPWPDRDAFMRAQAQGDRHMHELYTLLADSMPLQASFMHQRAATAFPSLLAAAPGYAREHLLLQYKRVQQSPMGDYVLTDYVNFKGEGSNPAERYQGLGWGLLQVLAEMRGEKIGSEAITEFARAADVVLTRRVSLAPTERHEERWLQGWRKRLGTYTAAATAAPSS